MNKFLNKNIDNFNNLNKFIDENYNNIRVIVTSYELFEYIKISDDCEIASDELIKYKNIRVIRDVYLPVKYINFVMKNNSIEFNVPCVCGYYKDEEHL